MNITPFELLIPKVTEQRKQDVISILRLTNDIREIDELIPINDQQWVRIHLPIITTFFGITNGVCVSYGDYILMMDFGTGETDWLTLYCSVLKSNEPELQFGAEQKEPILLSTKPEYEFDLIKSTEGLKIIVKMIAEIVYS